VAFASDGAALPQGHLRGVVVSAGEVMGLVIAAVVIMLIFAGSSNDGR
jgi:hypothetical protein